jgi:ABC-2 type transport system permease protein
MHARTILAIARKDSLDIIRNKSTPLVGLLFPIVLSLVWLLIGRLVGSSASAILVYDPSGSSIVQVVTGAFPSPVVTRAGSAAEVGAAFDLGGGRRGAAYSLGLIVPAGFDDSLRSGAHPHLQLYLDGGTVKAPTEALLQAAIVNFCRSMSDPRPPVDLSTTVINPSPKASVAAEMGQLYLPFSLLLSLVVGMMFVPQLLLEEKEKKTLRMLMVSPASFADVLVRKLLVVLLYQLALTAVVLAIIGGFTGQVALVALYGLLGGCFSLALGLLFGAAFDSVSAASAAGGPVMIVTILAGLFVGPLGQILNRSPVSLVARVLPMYYIAEGVLNASQSQGSLGTNVLDIGVIVASTLILLAVSAGVLRRQFARSATI